MSPFPLKNSNSRIIKYGIWKSPGTKFGLAGMTCRLLKPIYDHASLRRRRQNLARNDIDMSFRVSAGKPWEHDDSPGRGERNAASTGCSLTFLRPCRGLWDETLPSPGLTPGAKFFRASGALLLVRNPGSPSRNIVAIGKSLLVSLPIPSQKSASDFREPNQSLSSGIAPAKKERPPPFR